MNDKQRYDKLQKGINEIYDIDDKLDRTNSKLKKLYAKRDRIRGNINA